jgi:hypothetical protein
MNVRLPAGDPVARVGGRLEKLKNARFGGTLEPPE